MPESQDTGIHRGHYFTGANVVASIAIGIATQKWGTAVPDAAFIVLCMIPIALWLLWLWTHPKIRKRRMVYTYPIMSLTFMVVIGAVAGGFVSALLWWAARREAPLVEIAPNAKSE